MILLYLLVLLSNAVHAVPRYVITYTAIRPHNFSPLNGRGKQLQTQIDEWGHMYSGHKETTEKEKENPPTPNEDPERDTKERSKRKAEIQKTKTNL
jgi:hypothetical protein